MPTVVFSPQSFLLQYPEFNTIDQAAVINATASAGSVLTINSVTSGTVAVGEAICGSAIFVPATLQLGTTVSSLGTFNGTTGTVNLSLPLLNALASAPLTLYAWNILLANFNAATMYCRNDGGGPVTDLPTLTALLYLATAHITALNNGVNGQTPNQMVGRVTSAGLGSVHVSTELKFPTTAAFWAQTKYGVQFWQMSTQFRLGGHYVLPNYAM